MQALQLDPIDTYRKPSGPRLRVREECPVSPWHALKNHPFIFELGPVETHSSPPRCSSRDEKREPFEQQAMGLVEAFKQVLLPDRCVRQPSRSAFTSRMSPVAITRDDEIAILRHLHQAQPSEITGKDLEP
jgi:hypothetical protein